MTATSKIPLLERNIPRKEESPEDVCELEHFGFEDPAGRFDIPEGYEKQTPWSVSSFWMEHLEASGRWHDDWPPVGPAGVRRGLRAAKRLLEKYDYIDILRAIRWWSGPSGLKPGRAFTLNWLERNMDTFFQRIYERRNR